MKLLVLMSFALTLFFGSFEASANHRKGHHPKKAKHAKAKHGKKRGTSSESDEAGAPEQMGTTDVNNGAGTAPAEGTTH